MEKKSMLYKNNKHQQLSPEEDLFNFMIEHGYTGKELPIMDGRAYRVKVRGDVGTEKSGSLLAYSDGVPNATFINHRTVVDPTKPPKWTYKGFIDKQLYSQKEIAEKSENIKLENAKKAKLTAERASKQRDTLPSACKTKYHLSKGIQTTIDTYISKRIFLEIPFEDRYFANKNGAIWNNYDKKWYVYNCVPGALKKYPVVKEEVSLCIPVYNIDGKVTTMQYINESGVKRFASHGQKSGSMHVINNSDISKVKKIIIVEGYATGVSISEITKCPVIVSFNASNLLAVTKAICEKYPDKEILIAADNDRHKIEKVGKNVGVSAAVLAKDENPNSKILIITPMFKDGLINEDKKDFNDLARYERESLKKQIEYGLRRFDIKYNKTQNVKKKRKI